MQKVTTEFPSISYPALLWREGYTYLAATRLELCAHPRSMFDDTVQRARSGEWHLVDAEGRCFDVVDWASISPFGGIKGIGLRLLGSVFAAPVLANESKLSLPEFKKKLIGVIRSRYRHDSDKVPASQAIKRLQAAESHQAAIDALPKL
ncbi:hypothetical protein [Ralstonia pseudosolanacearum]